MNRHSIFLLVILVLIGAGMFSMVNYQKAHAYSPVLESREGGMTFGGGASAQPSMNNAQYDANTATDDAAACP